jgi:hypothetical protein
LEWIFVIYFVAPFLCSVGFGIEFVREYRIFNEKARVMFKHLGPMILCFPNFYFMSPLKSKVMFFKISLKIYGLEL